MDDFYLTSALHFSSAICLIMGMLLWVKAHDNRARRVLGISVTIFGLFFVARIFFTQNMSATPVGILPMGHLAGGCLAAFLLSLYPLEVIRPGWLTSRRIVLLLSPWLLMLGGLAGCVATGLKETVIPSASTILLLLGHVDIWFRLTFLALIFGYMLLIYLIPLLGRKSYPETCRWLYGFIFGMLAIHITFLLFMFTMKIHWDITHKVIVFFFTFYIGHKVLFHENPPYGQPVYCSCEVVYSRTAPAAIGPVAETKREDKRKEEESPESELWIRILTCMNNESPWLDADFLLPSLSSLVNSNRTSVSAEIHRHGVSFNELVSQYRIREFKRHMEAIPGIPDREALTDAWQSCGYRSYTTFYRNFCDIEKMTPAEYLKNKP